MPLLSYQRIALGREESQGREGRAASGAGARSAVFDPEAPFGLSSRPKADRRELTAESLTREMRGAHLQINIIFKIPEDLAVIDGPDIAMVVIINVADGINGKAMRANAGRRRFRLAAA